MPSEIWALKSDLSQRLVDLLIEWSDVIWNVLKNSEIADLTIGFPIVNIAISYEFIENLGCAKLKVTYLCDKSDLSAQISLGIITN